MTLISRLAESRPTASRRNPWPFAIVGYFIVFAAAMATWIVYAARQKTDLIGKDYYDREVLFQQQIDSVKRTQLVRAEVSIAYDPANQSITLKLPAAQAVQQITGRVCFYRPSDARLDREVQLALRSDGTQLLDAKKLRPGLWKVHVFWKTGGEDYYFDQPVVIGSHQS